MPFKVNEMVSSINKSGVAQASHFEVQITNINAQDDRELMSRADTVNLPGRTITTTEHKFTNYGPINKVPYSQIYGDLTVTFLLSEDMREKNYFEKWQNRMINTGAYEYGPGTVDSGAKFNTKYFNDYVGTILIRQYGSNGGLRTIHKLNEVYPILIGEVAMDWSSTDLAKLTVTFAYKNYEFVTEDNSNQPGLGLGFSFNLGKGGLKGALRIPGIGNISGRSIPPGIIAAASPKLINTAGSLVKSGVNKVASIFKGL